MPPVASTPASTDTMGLRMLVVHGSQTGTCTRLAKKMAENWKSRGAIASYDFFEGNTLAHETEGLESLKESYDVMVVCTSSFGEGDPPDNYNEFLLKLVQAAAEGNKPLAGMQHAVLGEGSSVYRETFQSEAPARARTRPCRVTIASRRHSSAASRLATLKVLASPLPAPCVERGSRSKSRLPAADARVQTARG